MQMKNAFHFNRSTYNLLNYPPRTQFAWPTFLDDGTHTDAWCQDPANVRRKRFFAPLLHSLIFFLIFRMLHQFFPCEYVAVVGRVTKSFDSVSRSKQVLWNSLNCREHLKESFSVQFPYSLGDTKKISFEGTTFDKILNFFRPAHSAPISFVFYDGVNCGVNGGFPCEATNDAFVAFRGYVNHRKLSSSQLKTKIL